MPSVKLRKAMTNAAKAGEKASNALAALRYEDADGGAGGGADGDYDDCDLVIDLRSLYKDDQIFP